MQVPFRSLWKTRFSAGAPSFFQASIPANQRELVQARAIYRCHHLDTIKKCQMNDVSFFNGSSDLHAAQCTDDLVEGGFHRIS